MEPVRIYENGMNIPPELGIIDFKGGLCTVQTGIDQKRIWVNCSITLSGNGASFLLPHPRYSSTLDIPHL
jgi:hypothetical protein